MYYRCQFLKNSVDIFQVFFASNVLFDIYDNFLKITLTRVKLH
jgi:hypothetical protein